MKPWALDEALAYVRALQPNAMSRGWCIMLAGGVLNHGHSDNDLDLLAYPRTQEALVEDLRGLLPAGIRWAHTPVSIVASYEHDGKAVELIFQTWPCPVDYWRIPA